MRTQDSSKKVTFVFIAHYVETWNWLWIFPFLRGRPQYRMLFLFLYPVCWVMSLVYLWGRKPFQVVDRFDHDSSTQGAIIMIRNFAWHFTLSRNFDEYRRRILASALYAQDVLKADVIGLGALTKAEWLTEGGAWLARQPGITVPIVHGDTFTAWTVAQRLQEILTASGETEVAVTGATSKIGRAVVLHLATQGFRFRMLTQSAERFEAIQNELPVIYRGNVSQCTSLAEAAGCRVWLTGKSEPDGEELLRILPLNAWVLNFSVPDPFPERMLKRRPDIRHVDAGLSKLPDTCGLQFMMRLKPGITYACCAGTILHAKLKWRHHEVGEVNIEDLQLLGEAGVTFGLVPADPTSFLTSIKIPEPPAQGKLAQHFELDRC